MIVWWSQDDRWMIAGWSLDDRWCNDDYLRQSPPFYFVEFWNVQWLVYLITGSSRVGLFLQFSCVFWCFLRRPVWDIGQWGRPKMAHFHQLLVWTVRKVGWGGLIWLTDVLRPGGFWNFFWVNWRCIQTAITSKLEKRERSDWSHLKDLEVVFNLVQSGRL